MNQFKIIIAGLFMLAAFSADAQVTPHPEKGESWKNGNPEYFRTTSTITNPPFPRPRAMAEWEELGALALSWDLSWSNERKDLLAEIAKYAKEEVEVIIFCQGNDFDVPRRVKNELAFRGVDERNISLIPRNFDSRIWIRDYGAHSLYLNGVDSLVFVDWLYEPEYKAADDDVPDAMAGFFGSSRFATIEAPYKLKLDGGNFLTDGLGLAFSSTHIYDDNPYQAVEFDSILGAFMGLKNYIKLEKLDHDVIHHVDMHMKLLDEETILVGKYPDGVADGPKIEANLNFLLEQFKTSFGTDFKVRRIIMPPDADGRYPDEINGCSTLGQACYLTYTNALFVNKTILVPQYFGGTGYDEQALIIWQKFMPGYRIIGIDCRDIIKDYGAIHCVAKEIGVRDPLLIVHKKLENQCADRTFYPIEAVVQHRSGIDQVTLYYKKVRDENFSSTILLSADGKNWSGYIPAYPPNTQIEYYLEARAINQKTLRRPIAAPAARWHFTVDCLVNTRETTAENKFAFYPNPAGEKIKIEIQNLDNQLINLQICDLDGKFKKEIFSGRLKENHQNLEFNTDQLAAGIYILQLICRDGIFSKKLVIR